jgi:hypothetical protein
MPRGRGRRTTAGFSTMYVGHKKLAYFDRGDDVAFKSSRLRRWLRQSFAGYFDGGGDAGSMFRMAAMCQPSAVRVRTSVVHILRLSPPAMPVSS